MIATSRLYIEKRKGIEKNAPIQLHIFFDNKRVSVFSTGIRCNLSQWDDDTRLMKRNQVNKAGQTSANVNVDLKALTGTVNTWTKNNPIGTIDELLVELRKVAGKKEKIEVVDETEKTIYTLFDEFLQDRKLSKNRHDHYLVLKRCLERFEKYSRKPLTFDIDLKSFEKYLTKEHTLIENQKQRGKNTVIGLLSKLRSFFLWAVKKRYLTTTPFNDYKLEATKYGTPYYLTIAERTQLYNYDFKARPQLAIQRDIFVFQCLVGCRVGDLNSLRRTNIIDGFLEYVARKTKDDAPVTVRVPLTSTAKEIVKRYAGNEMLLPTISEQNYNLAIKEMFEIAELNRYVTILNTVTRKAEQRPLNEVASSHLARRSFVGNLYAKVQDPNLVGSMSGHVEGSKSFARYRTITDDIKTDIINLIE